MGRARATDVGIVFEALHIGVACLIVTGSSMLVRTLLLLQEAALARAHERAMERYSAAAPERTVSALALPLADYGAALSRSIRN